MKILEINLPANPSLGLKAASMKHLGQIVVLAGRNGAGKSRMLQNLEKYCETPVSGAVWAITGASRQFAHVFSRKAEKWDDVLAELRKRSGQQPWSDLLDRLNTVQLDRAEYFKFVWLNPKSLELRDAREIPPSELEKSSRSARSSKIEELIHHALSLIEDIQNQWFHVQSELVTSTEEDRTKAIAEYERLQKIAQALLNTQFQRDKRGHASLFGKPIGEAALSEGQRVLLLWTVMLHSQVEHLNEAIIVFDEPENHLHPQALLDAIDGFIKAFPDVQIWIATHSLPLLSHFDPNCLFWVEDGAVEFAGTKPLKVLRGLLGNDDRIARLHDFLGLPANLATNRFAAQCLIPPHVSDRGEGDPQTGQIREVLANVKPEASIKLLDFGAGRGRLAASLNAAKSVNQAAGSRIDYTAFEPSDKHRDELRQRVSEFHGTDSNRVFSDLATLTSTVGTRAFDVVILTNVFHEIPVEKWLNYFGPEGRFLDLILPGGYLLLVEDTLLPVGESPHAGGFLVLENTALYEFLLCKPNELKRDTVKDNERLVAHLIQDTLVARPTADSLKKALKQVITLSEERIDAIRMEMSETVGESDGNYEYRAGREHGFYVHQFTNASRALRNR